MKIFTMLGFLMLSTEGESGSLSRVLYYLDYPGFEAWKFFNLFLFVGLLVFALKKFNLSDAFKTRSESIKAELEKARTERDAALAKLKEVEERLTGLNDQVSSIKDRSKAEAAAEQKRIAQSTEEELSKLSVQAQREIENAAKVARTELRRFAAEQSVRMAEELIKQEIKPEDDARLMAENIHELGVAR
jgi:DNA phosphorothioation-dependent restriction protein DptG